MHAQKGMFRLNHEAEVHNINQPHPFLLLNRAQDFLAPAEARHLDVAPGAEQPRPRSALGQLGRPGQVRLLRGIRPQVRQVVPVQGRQTGRQIQRKYALALSFNLSFFQEDGWAKKWAPGCKNFWAYCDRSGKQQQEQNSPNKESTL